MRYILIIGAILLAGIGGAAFMFYPDISSYVEQTRTQSRQTRQTQETQQAVQRAVQQAEAEYEAEQQSQMTPTLVSVYGRSTCSNTTQMTSYLRSRGIPYILYSVDEPDIADDLHDKMRAAGLDTGRYTLPVIEIGSKISIAPSPQNVYSAFTNAPS